MKLTKDEIEQIESTMAVPPFGSVTLICDGDEVTLSFVRAKGLRYAVAVYVNGWFRGEWSLAKNQHREQRYLRLCSKPLCKPAERAAAQKALGKRWVQKEPYYNARFEWYDACWPSVKSALKHLQKTCTAVAVKRDDERRKISEGAAA